MDSPSDHVLPFDPRSPINFGESSPGAGRSGSFVPLAELSLARPKRSTKAWRRFRDRMLGRPRRPRVDVAHRRGARARTVRRAAARKAAAASSSDGDGDGDGDGEPEPVAVLIDASGAATIFVSLHGVTVSLVGRVPVTAADFGTIRDLARRAAAGDTRVRWVS